MELDDQVRHHVEDLSRDIVGEVAPAELPYFERLAASGGKDGAGHKDDPLGFGLEQAVQHLTPAVIAAASAVTTYLLQQGTEALKDHGSDWVKKRVEALFNRPLSRDRLKEVEGVSMQVLGDFEIEPETARRISSALVGRLATAGE